MKRAILITGGAGFIGSHVVRLFVNKYPDYQIVNLDKLTYAGNLENLKDIEKNPNYTFVKADICDRETVDKLFQINTYEVVICTSGVFAIPVIQALNRNGTGNVKKIVVFDDLELPPIEGVTIWILRHAEQQMGRICAQKLLNLIAGKPEASCRLPWRYREEDE